MSPTQDGEYDKLKQARSTAKGQITAARNKLELLLKEYVGQEFDHDKINRLEIQETHAKLKSCFKHFQELHTKCLEAREQGSNEEDEETIMKDQESYQEDVASKVYPVLAIVDSYEKSYEAHVKKQQLNETIGEADWFWSIYDFVQW